jgi:hypothetical protein
VAIELERLRTSNCIVIAAHNKLSTLLKGKSQGVCVGMRGDGHALTDQRHDSIAKPRLTLRHLHPADFNLGKVVDVEPLPLEYELKVVMNKDDLREWF